MNAVIDVKEVKCSCTNCNCIVPTDKAFKGKDAKLYCSEECGTGHPSGKGCHHHGCNCG